VYFQLELIVHDMALVDAAVTFQYLTPRSIRVTLRQPTTEEAAKYKGFTTLCTASTEREPSSPAIRAAFEALAVGEVPEGTAPEEYIARKTPPRGRVIPSLSRLPESFRSFVDQVRGELHDAATRTVHVLRWRRDVNGPHSPFLSGGSNWSFDGQTWHPLPGEIRVIGEGADVPIRVDEAQRVEVENLVHEGRSEPLGHALLREAWQQRVHNLRSAIVVGVAAAEVGVKECIADLVPGARWLVERAPTPPLVDMLREYLPLLPARRRIGDRVKPPPDAILDALKKGVQLRNRVAHVGAASLSYDTVEEVLKAVHDVLWLLDYYRGFKWALDNLTGETMTALGLDSETPPPASTPSEG
jgi:hypothetical protein